MEELIPERDVDESAPLPLLPLQDVTAFPGVILNFEVEQPISVAALNAAISAGTDVLLLTQRDAEKAVPGAEDF